jgi:predicted acetyltransferase
MLGFVQKAFLEAIIISDIVRMQPGDHERVMDFYRDAFSHDLEGIPSIERVLYGTPFHKSEHHAFVEEDGRFVAGTALYPQTQRLGDGQISVGEIGCVGTRVAYRNRGLASRLMHYWCDYMRQNHIPLSFLFGIPNFYQQFGYEYAAPIHFYAYTEIERRLLARLSGSCTVAPMAENDLQTVARLYETSSADNPCSRIREPEYWRFKFTSLPASHRWFCVKQGHEIRGYFLEWMRADAVSVDEVGVLDDEAAAAIAGCLYHQTEGHPDTFRVGVKAPHNNRFSAYLYRHGARQACTNYIYPGSWGGMYRIIDLRQVMEKVRPTLEQRLADSRLYLHCGRYQIVSDIGAAGLEIDHGRVTISDSLANAVRLELPRQVLTPLITGYRDIDSCSVPLGLDEKEHQLLQILFPLGHPYIWDLEESEEYVQ